MMVYLPRLQGSIYKYCVTFHDATSQLYQFTHPACTAKHSLARMSLHVLILSPTHNIAGVMMTDKPDLAALFGAADTDSFLGLEKI